MASFLLYGMIQTTSSAQVKSNNVTSARIHFIIQIHTQISPPKVGGEFLFEVNVSIRFVFNAALVFSGQHLDGI